MKVLYERAGYRRRRGMGYFFRRRKMAFRSYFRKMAFGTRRKHRFFW